jgi:hypothetical protein
MPQIKPYSSQIGAAGTVDVRRANPETMGAAAGVGLEKLGNSVMGVADVLQQRKEQAEVSDLNAKLSKAHADFTISWQERLKKADPADTTLAENFNKEFDDYVGSLRENVETAAGEKYFINSSSQMQAHFRQSTYAGQAQLAGIKAREDFQQGISNRSSALLNDPTALDMSLQQTEADLEAKVAAGLPREIAEKLRGDSRAQLAKSAIRGWATLDPDHTLKQLKAGKWDTYVDGDVKHQMIGEANQAINAREIEANQKRAEQERIKRDTQDRIQQDMLSKIVNGGLRPTDILADKALDFGQKNQMLSILQQHVDKPPKTDPATYSDLLSRIHLPDGDPKKLVDQQELVKYAEQRRLSISDLNALRNEIDGDNTQEGKINSTMKTQIMALAKARLVKKDIMGTEDPYGQEQYSQFLGEFLWTYQDEVKKGKSPRQLLDPASQDYLGSKILNKYHKTPQQRMQEQVKYMQRVTPVVTPTPAPAVVGRQPGETTAQYLERMKKAGK